MQRSPDPESNECLPAHLFRKVPEIQSFEKRAAHHCDDDCRRRPRQESERFHCFNYEDLLKRDKLNLDIFWLKDESLEDSANLPSSDIIAREIVENLETAFEQFAEIDNVLAVKE